MDPEFFRSLTRPFTDPYLLLDGEGRILSFNERAARVLGVDASAAGRPLADYLVRDVAGAESFLRTFSRSTAFAPGSLHWHAGNGNARRYRVDGARVETGGGGGSSHLVMLRFRAHEQASERFIALNGKIEELNREIHQRRETEAVLQEQATQLEELASELELTIDDLGEQRARAWEARDAAEAASRAKSDFLAVMSHELRTPLNAIIGYVDLLEAGIGGQLNDVQREHVARVRRSARHLVALIEEVLTFSRLDAKRETVHFEVVDPVPYCREAIELVEPTAAQRGLSLHLDVPEAVPLLETDAAKLQQILLNLLANAVKYTERGEVGLELSSDEREIRFAVRDTGIGIAEADLDRVFQPFTQLDSRKTRRAGGTGLGLAVSRELARLIGGDITVLSVPGEGSTFVLHLPREPQPKET